MAGWLLPGGVLCVAVAVLAALSLPSRVRLPPHLLGHKLRFVPNLLTPEQGEALRTMAREMKDFPTNVADLKFYTTLHEHAGEGRPIGADGRCDHAFLVPSVNRTMCVLPGRIDVGKHYIMSGGVEGLKEPFESMSSRVQSFGRYMFDLDKYEMARELFASEQFLAAARSVCPAEKQTLDPFQFNFILQVPGQTVALHLDAPYFWGATRFQLPQWLLVAMVFSGLFEDRFVDQVQLVGYFHAWNDTTGARRGQFVYWDSNAREPKSEAPMPLAGSAVDGSKTVHAATVYGGVGTKAPLMDKSKENILRYVGNDKWHLLSGSEVIQTYSTNDLRMTIVYRARCFASEEERMKFRDLPEEKMLQLEDVMETLRRDLVRRGRLSETQFRDSSSPDDRLKLSLAILDEYVRYPLSPTALVPYNYCALGRMWPSADTLLRFVC